MKDYYEILGVPRGASEHEIKRSYFKLVRMYPPEQHPDKFKEIREAYEYLRDEKNRQDQPEDLPEDPWARRMLDQIKKCIEYRDYWTGADTAEEAAYLFPKHGIFLFYLCFCERKAGYTGRAVKNCQKLLDMEPDNIRYKREMALAYAARGYRKKAIEAFGQAYACGCRDLEFVLEYSICCDENCMWQTGRDILVQAAEQKNAWSKEDVGELLDVYSGIFQLNSRCVQGMDRVKVICGFSDLICRCSLWMEDYSDDLVSVLFSLAKACTDIWQDIRPMLDKVCETLEDIYISDEARESLKRFRRYFSSIDVLEDDRFSQSIKLSWSYYNDFEDMDCWDEDEKRHIQKYGELDCQLCMLADMPGILKEFELLKEVSPDYYSKLSGFIRILEESSNLDYLKHKLLKEYRRMSEYMSGGQYFRLHPEEKQSGSALWEEEVPYVRQEKKIGRNDPCPCGSGKKYKKCCGKNA